MNTCKHERIFSISGKCSDLCQSKFHDGTETNEYAPREDFGLGSGDYIRVKVCLDCHVVIGFSPAKYEAARLGAIEDNERAEERKRNRLR